MKILVVDDDSSHIQLVEYLLGNHYNLAIANNGEEALRLFRHDIPDLVLLDINMPGMSGYEVCQAIKEEDYSDDVAVIFVSGSDSVEERTKGYEVGGDDYVVKPFQVGEFRKKIDATARYQRTKKNLEKQQDQARNVAFESMKEASQYGQVLQFLKDSFHQNDLPSLADTLFKALDQFSLHGCLQVRLPDNTLSLRPFNQPCSPIELELFSMLREKGRVFIFGERMIVNDTHVSLLIKNLPKDDENLAGRLRDVLAVITEGFEARLMDLQRKKAITSVLERLDGTIDLVKNQFTEYTRRNVAIMDDLLISMNESMHVLGLTDEQEQYYFGLVESALTKLIDTCDYGSNISDELNNMMSTVKPLIE
ncbi:MAG: response regulator [Pseudomonadales bacterium]|nr:response regulator [Pseudomonadales bacterium]